MPNIQRSIFAHGLTRSGRVVIADHPMFDDERISTEPQAFPRDSLWEATTFAQMALEEQVYIDKAREMGTTAYNVAIVDWLGSPKVLEIDVDDWTGDAGQIIHVKARDNVMVARVTVAIKDQQENLLETGEAVQVEERSAWWNYTTQSKIMMTPFPIVEAIAQDLPGNTDSFAIS